jgi:CMP-2-keto-3-deoxyoctulosonic acid synthetase
MIRKLMAAALVVVVGGFAVAAEIKSGPQAGEKLAGPFHPLNVNGESAGKKACLYCSNGDNPVAMVFARTIDASTEKLIAAIEKETVANSKCDMGAFVVFLSDDDKMADKLKEVAEKLKLKKVILSVDNPAGPEKYKVAKEADVTVVLYTERTSKVNMAFEKGKMTDKDIEAVVKGVSKITPSK